MCESLPVSGATRKDGDSVRFPERVYTHEEVRLARSLIGRGYRHRLRVAGSSAFKEKTRQALRLARTAGYYDFLRTYVRTIREIQGLSQLREAEASIWANLYAVDDQVEAACFFVQKAWQMKAYIEGRTYYGHIGETKAARMRRRFLNALRRKAKDQKIREECRRKIDAWKESKFL